MSSGSTSMGVSLASESERRAWPIASKRHRPASRSIFRRKSGTRFSIPFENRRGRSTTNSPRRSTRSARATSSRSATTAARIACGFMCWGSIRRSSLLASTYVSSRIRSLSKASSRSTRSTSRGLRSCWTRCAKGKSAARGFRASARLTSRSKTPVTSSPTSNTAIRRRWSAGPLVRRRFCGARVGPADNGPSCGCRTTPTTCGDSS